MLDWAVFGNVLMLADAKRWSATSKQVQEPA